MDKKEIDVEMKMLPKDEKILVMKFRLLSPEKKIQFILDVDKELEEVFGLEGRKIFDSIFE